MLPAVVQSLSAVCRFVHWQPVCTRWCCKCRTSSFAGRAMNFVCQHIKVLLNSRRDLARCPLKIRFILIFFFTQFARGVHWGVNDHQHPIEPSTLVVRKPVFRIGASNGLKEMVQSICNRRRCDLKPNSAAAQEQNGVSRAPPPREYFPRWITSPGQSDRSSWFHVGSITVQLNLHGSSLIPHSFNCPAC